MMLAYTKNNERIRAYPHGVGFCPECEDELIPKCGTIKVHHWAHYKDSKCYYGEGMSEWHLGWQDFALNNGADVEVPLVDRTGNKRRADILYKNRVIELQHSNISETEIISRSNFYVGLPEKRLRCDWLIDYTKNNFTYVCEDAIEANGNHKKGFDCLFGRLYGNIIFDMGDSVFFAYRFVPKKTFEKNDFGTKVSMIYNYYGETKYAEEILC